MPEALTGWLPIARDISVLVLALLGIVVATVVLLATLFRIRAAKANLAEGQRSRDSHSCYFRHNRQRSRWADCPSCWYACRCSRRPECHRAPQAWS